eukprot:2767888-Prymnesium_polylepis.1
MQPQVAKSIEAASRAALMAEQREATELADNDVLLSNGGYTAWNEVLRHHMRTLKHMHHACNASKRATQRENEDYQYWAAARLIQK